MLSSSFGVHSSAKVHISEDKTKNINIFIGLILEPGDFNLKGTKKICLMHYEL